MRLAGLAIVVIVLALAACGGDGGDSERVLVLGSGDTTEAEFRADIRAFLVGIGAEDFCAGLAGLSDDEIADTLTRLSRASGNERVQEPDPGDVEYAGGIVKEECDRVG